MERTCQLQSLHTRVSGKKNLKLHSPKLKQAMFSFKKNATMETHEASLQSIYSY